MRYRSSPRTSCKVGSFREALGADQRPRSDAAYAFAAAHDRSAAHLLCHAASTLPFSNSGALWAVRKLAVSADHRPPTSPARTTSLLLPLPVQGTFALSASSRQRGLRLVWSQAVPSPRNALTNVTSIASWAPLNSDNPSATTSKRLPSTPGTCERWSKPLLHLGRCVPRPPPPGILCDPEHPKQRTQTDDGQGSRGDGHNVQKISESVRIA